MAKLLHNNKGFTLIETLIVLMIISILLVLTINAKSWFAFIDNDNIQINEIVNLLNFYQSEAIASQRPVVLIFRKHTNRISVIQDNNRSEHELKNAKIMRHSNLEILTFNKEGHVNQFGTIRFMINNNVYAFIYHIEKGRYRIEKQ